MKTFLLTLTTITLLWTSNLPSVKSESDCSTTFDFTEVDVGGSIAEVVENVAVGFEAPENCALDSVNVTRMVWTIEPAPDGQSTTTVKTIPPNLVEAEIMPFDPDGDGFPESEALYFRPTQLAANFDGEAGVLIQIPKDQLKRISLDSPDRAPPAPHLLQINDGFTQLSFLRVSGTYLVGNLGPSHGSTVKAKVLSTNEPLNLIVDCGSCDLQVETTSFNFDPTMIQTYNSNVKLKGDIVGDLTIDGGSTFQCTTDPEACGTRVLIEGAISGSVEVYRRGATSEAESLNPEMSLTVNDPTGTFSCEGATPANPEGLATCTTSDEQVPGDSLSCTTIPESLSDLITCVAQTFQSPETCACTLASVERTCPDRPLLGTGYPCISDSVWGYTQCLINDCPTVDDICTGDPTEVDSCDGIEGVCTTLSQECCPQCACNMAYLTDCVVGELCPPFNCASPLSGTNTTRRLLEDPPRFLQEESLSCLSEAIRGYTECVIRECPTADAVCEGTAPDGDTCGDVQAMCNKITSECCPPCGEELAILLDCSTEELCPPFVCGGTTGTPSSGAVSTPKMMALLIPSVLVWLI